MPVVSLRAEHEVAPRAEHAEKHADKNSKRQAVPKAHCKRLDNIASWGEFLTLFVTTLTAYGICYDCKSRLVLEVLQNGDKHSAFGA